MHYGSGKLAARVVVAGTHSGVGKTTVATGIMAALRARGLRIGAAKVGPDFIDPGYHRLAAGRPSRCLDAFLSGEGLLASIAAEAGADCDVLVVEGVMGLFDGSAQPGCDGSTAAVAKALDAPVVLVVDASAMSGSVAALVHGFATFDPALRLGGVILNRVGSEGHAVLLEEALVPLGVPVLGALLNDDRLAWRERHLGLVPVAEQPHVVEESLQRLGEAVASRLDLEAIVNLARSVPEVRTHPLPLPGTVGHARIAVCSGPAFSFVYPENLQLFELAGAELAFFDPLVVPALPDGCTGLYAGGGFPEVFAPALAENRRLLAEIGRRAGADLVTWAECGGFMWLAETIDGHPMSGALRGVSITMTDKLVIGYRSASTRKRSFLGPPGTHLLGHEYHRSLAEPPGDGLVLESRWGRAEAGYLGEKLFAGYLHQHLASTPQLAERFIAAATQEAL
ncbi:MAG TPA: cobyrinate a,c-diamide synthase [Acidimicrobiales bacterium]|nr:cobyrinate a,c-diamide synthase [Acidimicrobiales bacterium]